MFLLFIGIVSVIMFFIFFIISYFEKNNILKKIISGILSGGSVIVALTCVILSK